MKIRMIYLAAGNSRRFGSNKLLYKTGGKPLFAYGLDVLIKVLEERELFGRSEIGRAHV